ncbi:MAG: cation diffusion facilitator family transporter [Alphaproteobacteria bacterium]|nr:cation diffusion facilitator family transporter [Alphaproteobacteria bacterium]
MKLLNNQFSEHGLKVLAATASIATAVALTLLKAFAAFMTGSLSILSSTIDSLADAVSSLMTLAAVNYADKPLTREHRFGYGKIETVSALVQAAFISGSAGFILFDGIYRFMNPTKLSETSVGIYIMLVSLVITTMLIALQKYVINRVRSQAIKADNAHYKVDLITNGGVLLSMLAVHYWHWDWCDIVAALLISAYLLYSAGLIAKEALDEITDKEAGEDIRQKIVQQVLNVDGVKGYHDLRTRLSGSSLFIEIHLEFDGTLTLYETHELSDIAEQKIADILPKAQTIIHQDPYGLHEKRLDHDIDGKCRL